MDKERTERLVKPNGPKRRPDNLKPKAKFHWGLILISLLFVFVVLFFIYSLVIHNTGSTGENPEVTNSSKTTGESPDGNGPAKNLSINPEHQQDYDWKTAKHNGLFYTNSNQFGYPEIMAISRRGTILEVMDVDGKLYETKYLYDWGEKASTLDCTLDGFKIGSEQKSVSDYPYGTTMNFHIYVNQDALYVTSISYPESSKAEEDIISQDITYLRENEFDSIDTMTQHYFGKSYSPF